MRNRHISGHTGSTASTRAQTPAQVLIPSTARAPLPGIPCPSQSFTLHVPGCTLTIQASLDHSQAPAPSSCFKGLLFPWHGLHSPGTRTCTPISGWVCFPLHHSGGPCRTVHCSHQRSCCRDRRSPQLQKQHFAKRGQRQNTPAAGAAAGAP